MQSQAAFKISVSIKQSISNFCELYLGFPKWSLFDQQVIH